jgi:hypothetical protein
MELDLLSFDQDGVRLLGGSWELYESSERVCATCVLRLSGYKPHEVGYYSRPQLPPTAGWVLTIERKRAFNASRNQTRTARAYEARIAWSATARQNDQVGPFVTVLRGDCRTWPEAVNEVSKYALVVPAIQRLGAQLYATAWSPVRAFRVVYPWSKPAEPNRAYSPFQLVGGFDFNPESDGVSAHVLGDVAVADFVTKLGGNAYLVGPDGAGQYQVHHRNSMRDVDEIDIDDWRGRIVAGTGDDSE